MLEARNNDTTVQYHGKQKHVICTSSSYHVFAYLVLVACFYDACKMPSCCFGQIVVITCRVCVEPLLRFECALYETCLILHVVSYYLIESLF